MPIALRFCHLKIRMKTTPATIKGTKPPYQGLSHEIVVSAFQHFISKLGSHFAKFRCVFLFPPAQYFRKSSLNMTCHNFVIL